MDDYKGLRNQGERMDFFNTESCEICNAGLCSGVDKLKDQGLSEKKAFKTLADQTDGMYSPGSIRQRYKYYKGGEKPSPHKKLTKREKKPIQKINREAMLSDEFREAFDRFVDAIINAKDEKWKTTSKEAVLKHLKSVSAIIQTGE